MGTVSRYSDLMIKKYLEKGYWTEEITVDYWERNAVLYPDREALVDSHTRLTWLQAIETIDSLAAGFLELGINKNSVLISQLFSSVQMVLVRLACEKAGILAASIPPTFRKAEVEAVIEATEAVGAIIPLTYRNFNYFELYSDLSSGLSGPKFFFVLDDPAPQGALSLSSLGMQGEKALAKGIDLNRQKFGPFEFTEVMTTSGSTGLPKCVEWTACARLASGRTYIDRLELTENDTVVAFSHLSAGTTDLVLHRAVPQAGAKTVILEQFNPERAFDTIQREGATGAVLVPTMLNRMVNSNIFGHYDLSCLRFIVSFAGFLSPELLAEAENLFHCKVVQGYGGMDVGAVASSALDDPAEKRRKTVGKPMPGNTVYVVDQNGRRLPAGQSGLIVASGPHLVGGYFKDPEATSEAWRGGMFAMGDLGSFDRSQYLSLEGREKDIIIRGGQNLSPKEIENILSEHPGVRDMAVVKMPDKEMGEKACAFVVLRQGERLTLEEVIAFFKDKGIAAYKIPERLEVIEELPLTPAGNKVNKRRLETLIAERLERERA